MAFKLNISEKGKAWKIESDNSFFEGKKLGLKFDGKELSEDLQGYELEISGATDFAGFAHKKGLEGPGLRKVLLTKGWGMHKRPRKEGKKKVSTPKGLRLRKSYRGEQLSDKTIQINISVLKAGAKALAEIFPDQNKAPEPEKKEEPATAPTSTQTDVPQDIKTKEKTEVKEEKQMEETKEEIKEEIKEEVAEEIKDDIPSSPETKSEEQKEEAAEKVAEEVAEESEEVAEEIAEKEESEKKDDSKNDSQ